MGLSSSVLSGAVQQQVCTAACMHNLAECGRLECSPLCKAGYTIHTYAATASMHASSFCNADGDLLIVPQQGDQDDVAAYASRLSCCFDTCPILRQHVANLLWNVYQQVAIIGRLSLALMQCIVMLLM